MRTLNNYEPASEYDAPAYTVASWGRGIAFAVLGWETEPDEDTEWSGYENRTGRLIVRMIGDDRNFSENPDDLTPIREEDFCPECGQVGCHCYR